MCICMCRCVETQILWVLLVKLPRYIGAAMAYWWTMAVAKWVKSRDQMSVTGSKEYIKMQAMIITI